MGAARKVGKANGSRECAPDGVPTETGSAFDELRVMVGTARSVRLRPAYDVFTNLF